MTCESCSFETDRLAVRNWHSAPDEDWPAQDLAELVVDLMTKPVTRSLPSDWQGTYTIDRAAEWVNERDREGATLLARERSTSEAVGLVMLFEMPRADGAESDVRLGYLLAESAWGRGLGSELIGGLVDWCRARASIRSLAGGVAADNAASARVLEKNGFSEVEADHDDPTRERLFTLNV